MILNQWYLIVTTQPQEVCIQLIQTAFSFCSSHFFLHLLSTRASSVFVFSRSLLPPAIVLCCALSLSLSRPQSRLYGIDVFNKVLMLWTKEKACVCGGVVVVVRNKWDGSILYSSSSSYSQESGFIRWVANVSKQTEICVRKTDRHEKGPSMRRRASKKILPKTVCYDRPSDVTNRFQSSLVSNIPNLLHLAIL